MHRLLLIEDDREIVEMLEPFLVREGFAVTAAFDGLEGMLQFGQGSYDIVIVDLMMPKIDGIEVIKRIRERSSVPILIMSAKDSDVDKALGLGFGADDYIAKPFSIIEIVARLKAIIRRATVYMSQENVERPSEGISSTAAMARQEICEYGALKIDLDNYSVMKQDEEIKLTSKEFDILRLFITNPNRVFTKAQIYGFVWKDDYYGDENVINVHIRRLREKIELNPSEPVHLKTLWGIGYKWEG